MQTHNERGIALVLALFLMSALSVLAASMMFLSQTETYASMNYRMMSQARYAAEAGVQRAGNFLFDTTQYTKPSPSGTDLLSNYDATKSPVVCLSGCPNSDPKNPNHWVILSGVSTQQSNYPVASVVTNFNNAAHGTITVGNTTLNYGAYAKLISMQTFDPYGAAAGGTPGVVQTWEITSDGTLTGSRNATVEVVAYAEQPVWPANAYGAFATGATCGAMYFHGNVTINSYDSSQGPPSGSGNSTLSTGGNVGTNGNLDIQGSVDVQGNLYTPRSGVGGCSAAAVDALSETGSAQIRGSMVQLPAAVTYPSPPMPSPLPPTGTASVNSLSSACTTLGFTGSPLSNGVTMPTSWCTTVGSGSSGKVVIDSAGAPISLPNVTLGINVEIVARGTQMVNINSLDLSSGGNIMVKPATSTSGLIMDVVGKLADGVTDMTSPVVEFGGNSGGTYSSDIDTTFCTTCSTNQVYDASLMQFVYSGPGTINFRGNSAAAATFYAPNATVNFNGTADLYGSMLGKTVTNGGNANIHYDRRLNRDFYVQGAQMLGTFTWKRY